MGQDSNNNRIRWAKQLAMMASDLRYIRQEIDDIKRRMECWESRFVSLDRFERVEKIVYGAVGIILAAVLLALIALVIQQGGAVP